MSPQSQAIIVVAAGRGARAGEGLPKQYRSLAGETILCRTLRALYLGAPEARLLVVIHPDDLGLYEEAIAGFRGSCAPGLRRPFPAAPRVRRVSAPVWKPWR